MTQQNTIMVFQLRFFSVFSKFLALGIYYCCNYEGKKYVCVYVCVSLWWKQKFSSYF